MSCLNILGKAVPMDVTVLEVSQRHAILQLQGMARNDPRQILPAIISYGRR